MKKYKCKICGRIIDIDSMEKLEKCPYCGAGASLIEEIETEDDSNDSFKKIEGPIPIDSNNPSINRIKEKCINCGLCSKICQEKVGITYNREKSLEAVCINCGRCIINCPTGALTPKYCYKKVIDFIHDTEKVMIAYTSPAVRVALGEEFGLEPGTNIEKKLVTALKKIGFKYVFDTTFGADLTIMEEVSELIERIKNNKNLPQFTSCCPSWVKYVEIYHSELLNNLSTAKSPIGMQGAIVKNYFSLVKKEEKENIITVAITPCTAKKAEIKREEIDDTDYVITTTELAMMIRESGIDFNSLEENDYDDILGRGSGAGVIFGNSGGVMEAALRCAYKFITNNELPSKLLEFNEVRGYDSLKEATLDIGDINLKVLVVHGMTNIEKLIKSGDYKKYHFIEVMNCPGGCVGGGGQPMKIISKQQQIIESRIKGLYEEDKNIEIKACYNNPDIINIYNNYLEKPLSDKSIELLHTKYTDKSSILGD